MLFRLGRLSKTDEPRVGKAEKEKVMPDLEFQDEALADALTIWLRESFGDNFAADPDHEKSRSILTSCFKDGWAACMQVKLGPAFDLALMLTRMIAKVRGFGGDVKLVLDTQALDMVEKMCTVLLGNVDLVGLAEHVELVDANDLSDEEKAKLTIPKESQ